MLEYVKSIKLRENRKGWETILPDKEITELDWRCNDKLSFKVMQIDNGSIEKVLVISNFRGFERQLAFKRMRECAEELKEIEDG